jgi:hypothetical protein
MATPVSPQFIPTTLDTAILNTTLADYRQRNTDNVYNENVLLNVLNSKCKEVIDGGGSIVEPLIEKEQNNGGFYIGDDALSTTQSNTQTMVEFQWQNAYEPIQITRDEERQNSGEQHKILNLMAVKTQAAEKAIAKRIEQALSYPVAGAGKIIDLETLVGTGTAGSINGAADTFWQSVVTTSGAFATQGLSDMTTAFYAVSSSADMDSPNLILTNKTIFKKYEDTRLPLERISNGNLAANAGFKSLTFKGEPVVYGNFIRSGKLFMLNLNYLKFYVDSMTDFIITDFKEPVNQTAKVAYVLWRGAMGTNNRRRQAKLQSIT